MTDGWPTALKDIVAARGLSGRQAAVELGLPQQTVHNWLHGVRRPSDESLRAVLDRLDATSAERRAVWSQYLDVPEAELPGVLGVDATPIGAGV